MESKGLLFSADTTCLAAALACATGAASLGQSLWTAGEIRSVEHSTGLRGRCSWRSAAGPTADQIENFGLLFRRPRARRALPAQAACGIELLGYRTVGGLMERYLLVVVSACDVSSWIATRDTHHTW